MREKTCLKVYQGTGSLIKHSFIFTHPSPSTPICSLLDQGHLLIHTVKPRHVFPSQTTTPKRVNPMADRPCGPFGIDIAPPPLLFPVTPVWSCLPISFRGRTWPASTLGSPAWSSAPKHCGFPTLQQAESGKTLQSGLQCPMTGASEVGSY